jgi:hypothetical protein
MSASPESLALLNRAAELRAAGTPWSDAATQLAVEHAELRRLVAEHGRDYERLARRARTELRRDTLHEALAALRTQLQSPDDRVKFLAATTVIRYEMALMRYGDKAAAEGLERSTRRPRKLAAEAHDVRAENVSESPKVPNPKDVNGAQKVAQSSAPAAPATPPQAPARPVPPVATNNAPPLSEAERRKRLVMQAAVRPAVSAPLERGERTIQSWLGG